MGRASEELEGLPVPAWTAGPEGDLRAGNRALVRLLGELAPDRPYWASFPPSERSAAEAAHREALEGGVGYTLRVSLTEADGAVAAHEVRVGPQRDEAGAIVGWSGVLLPARSPGDEQDLLRQLMDRLPVMMTLYDPGMDVVVVNRTLTALLGWTTEDARRSDLLVLCYPDPELRREAAAFMGAPDQGWRRFEVTARDGRRVPSSWANFRLSDDRMVGVGVDLTELEAAQQQLEQYARKYRLALEAADLAPFEYDLVSGRAWMSARARDVLGISERHSAREALNALILPGDRPAARQALERARDGGHYEQDLRIVRPDGLERTISAMALLQHEGEGELRRPVRLVGTLRDITDQRAAERALRRQAALLELSHEAIVVWRLSDGEIVFWNRGAGALYGFSQDEVLGRSVQQLLGSRHTIPWQEVEQVIRAEGSWSGELVHTTADGEVLCIATRQQLITEPDGEELILEINRDITDERAYRRALERADREKDEFLAMLGHELRNPLMAISTAARVLRGTDGPGAAAARQVIERQSKHMGRLVDDLLEVSRVVRGKIVLRREPVELVEVVGEAISGHAEAAAAREVDIALEAPDGPVTLAGDRMRLLQLADNLLSNAVKFSERGGHIVVRVEVREGRASLTVTDTGVGMEPELLARIFEPFRQGAQDLARSGGGLGLGLALVRGIAELHGGGVAAHSEGRGRGAELEVWLPIEEAREAERPQSEPRVLLVEDNVDAAAMLAEVLRLEGLPVDVAHTGEEALVRARAVPPDVVLCDIGLPGISGYDVARALRSEPSLSDVRLIAVTGYGLERDRRAAQEAGFDQHVRKPVDPDDIVALIREGEAV